jgi:hypothetical protein
MQDFLNEELIKEKRNHDDWLMTVEDHNICFDQQAFIVDFDKVKLYESEQKSSQKVTREKSANRN